ncbi:MAG: hypothetical protein R2861_06305 [Desulfobacterales bacterium]
MHPQIHYWLMAIRPRTLPAGAAPVVLGLGLAWEKRVVRGRPWRPCFAVF